MRILAIALAACGFLLGTPALAAVQPETQLSELFGYNDVSWAPVVQERRVIMPEFAQANPAWSGVRFHEHRTLGEKGCAVFSGFIAARQSGYQGNAIDFTRSLQLLGSFDQRGRLEWSQINRIVPLVAERLPDQQHTAFSIARNEVRNGNVAALQLRTPWTREHWVAAVGLAGNDLMIIDPAGGLFSSFQTRYEVDHIRGLTVFRRLPARTQFAAAT